MGIRANADTRPHIRSDKAGTVKTVFHCCDDPLAKSHEYQAVSSLMSPTADHARSVATRDDACIEVPALSCSDKEIVPNAHRVNRHPDLSSLTG
jgi:hypothetical protein